MLTILGICYHNDFFYFVGINLSLVDQGLANRLACKLHYWLLLAVHIIGLYCILHSHRKCHNLVRDVVKKKPSGRWS